jgi:hypothetical protein
MGNVLTAIVGKVLDIHTEGWCRRGGVEKAAGAGRHDRYRPFTGRAEIGPNPPAFLEPVLFFTP